LFKRSGEQGEPASTSKCPGIEAVATRDSGPFEAMGVPVINPWKV
jgi:hypothetical protein